MSAEPWYDLNTQIWLGVAGGVFGGLWGSALGVLGGVLIPKGKGKGVVFGLLWAGLVLGVSSGMAAVVALVCGQPYGVWYPLLLGCVPLTPLAVVFLFVVRHRYRLVELRKMQAEEIM